LHIYDLYSTADYGISANSPVTSVTAIKLINGNSPGANTIPYSLWPYRRRAHCSLFCINASELYQIIHSWTRWASPFIN